MHEARPFALFAGWILASVFATASVADDKPAAPAKPEAKAEAKPAEKDKPKAKASDKAKRTPEQILAKKDKNKDGALDEKEFLGKKKAEDAAAVAKFAKRDRNGDGKITKAELTSGGKKAKKAKKAGKAAKRAKKAEKKPA